MQESHFLRKEVFFFPAKLFFVKNETTRDEVVSHIVRSNRGSLPLLEEELHKTATSVSRRHLARLVDEVFSEKPVTDLHGITDHNGAPVNTLLIEPLIAHAHRNRLRLLVAQLVTIQGHEVMVWNDRKGTRWWASLKSNGGLDRAVTELRDVFGPGVILIPHGDIRLRIDDAALPEGLEIADYLHRPLPFTPGAWVEPDATETHAHLDQLEAESIRIIREAVANASKPAMLFSLGKDSMVMWALAKKAFWPEPPPIPLALIDSRWEFQEVYQVLDYIRSEPGTTVLVHTNPEAIEKDVNPFDFGSAGHTDITRTQGLRQFLNLERFDFIFGGGRRDEERSRAKERVFSLRNEHHGWDPKTQRPELWNVFNTALPKNHSMRVFPLSNWTELDVWRYIQREQIPVVPLYFSKTRPFVERDGALIAIDDDRFRLEADERVYFEPIRFRTLGCYPLTGGERSSASTVADIIRELETTRVSERSSRVIDADPGASMEQKKKEGYF